jgi:peptidyl-prolyl cis-trans isomerase SurA
MKRLLVVFIVTLLAAGAQAQENRIAAVVNNDIITMDDLAARTSLVMASSQIPDTPENRQRLAPRLLNQLIDEKLQIQEARRLNLTVSQKEIDDALASIEKRNNMPKGGLEDYLKRAGVPKSALVSQVTASIAWGKVVQNMLEPDVAVSNEEINETMAQLKEESGKPQSHVAEIFLAVDNPTQEDSVRRLAERLIEQIRHGANFASVAQQFSQSPSSAVGGDIGWVTPSQLGPLLGDALKKMKPGEMSYPIQTPGGFYILYVSDRRVLGEPNPEETKLSLVEVIFPNGPDRQRTISDAQHVADEAKSCGELAQLGRTHVPPLSTHTADITAGSLPPNVRQQVLALKLAQASQPIPMTDTQDFAVFMVCQREDPQGGMPSRDQVAETLARQRLDALARRYLGDLRRAAYLDIRA